MASVGCRRGCNEDGVGVKSHGSSSPLAGARLDEDGDLEDSAVWRRVLAAIEELERGRREDEAVN